MDDIDFQNGFLCGMATKGLVRSGEQYKPACWNDNGAYGYFYIDFRRAMTEFSLGMLNESIIVSDTERIAATDVTKISTGVYKVSCDLSGKSRGVTVVGKKSTLLSFANGEPLPVFSVLFYVVGIPPVMRMAYAYDKAVLGVRYLFASTEAAGVEYRQYFDAGYLESVQYPDFSPGAIEDVYISYWNT